MELAWALEHAFDAAWPALAAQPCGDWRIKLGGGVSRRSNSANPLGPHAVLDDATLAQIIAAYGEAGLPAYVRLPSILKADVEGFLAAQGFEGEGGTLTLVRPLAGADAATGVDLSAAPDAQWLAASNAINGRLPAEATAFDAILGLLTAESAFAAIRREGRIAALAYGVRHENWLCVEAVATDPDFRGRGLAGQAVGALMAWGAARGASMAGLQVSADNTPARAVYARLGFDRELYRYHYRKAPAP